MNINKRTFSLYKEDNNLSIQASLNKDTILLYTVHFNVHIQTIGLQCIRFMKPTKVPPALEF